MNPRTQAVIDKLLPLTTDHRKRWHKTTFYRYQNNVWRMIMAALIDNIWLTDGATEDEVKNMETVDIPVEFTRQSGKTTTVVHTVEDILLFVTKLFNRPLRIGIFAPQSRQARTDFVRLKNALQVTRTKLQVVTADDRRVEKEASNAHELILADGSYVMIYPITSQSKPESESFDLIIIEEAQDADDQIVLEQILPMGSSTNAPVVWIGTAGIQICNFYWLIQKGQAYVMKWREIAADRRRLFELTGDAWHLIYEQRVKNLIKKYGEDSDTIRRPYNNEWILEAGMFITLADLAKGRVDKPYDDPQNYPGYPQFMKWYREGRRTAPEIDQYQQQNNISDTDISLFRVWCEADHYFGLDTAKQHDQTVLKIGREIEDRLTVVRSLELKGVNYHDQFYIIKAELDWFNIACGSIDSTGQGDFMPDMFERETSYVINRVKFSMQTKDVMYKSWYQKAVNDKFGYYWQDPDKSGVDDHTARSADEFERESTDLTKDYRGNYMVVKHRDEKNGHDDHPDATVLMGHAFDSYNINSGIKQYYQGLNDADESAATDQKTAIAEANNKEYHW